MCVVTKLFSSAYKSRSRVRESGCEEIKMSSDNVESVMVDPAAQNEDVTMMDLQSTEASEEEASVRTADEQPAAVVSTDSVCMSASAEYASYLANSAQLCWAVTNFKAPFYEPTSRAPVDIVAVIDKSGSMRGEQLRLVKKTLLFMIDQCMCCVSLLWVGWGRG